MLDRTHIQDAPTLAEAMVALRKTPNLSTVREGLAVLLRSGRVREFLYGAWCFARHAPRPLHPPLGVPPAWLERFRERKVDGWFTAAEMQAHPAHRPFLKGVPEDSSFRVPAMCRFGSFGIFGEYCEGKRLFFGRLGEAARADHHYAGDDAVRHIHCIFPAGRDSFFVSTGDAAKYLDLWRFTGDGIAFEKRLVHHLAGYTAAAAAGNHTFFGSDFSGRPNFLLRWEDGRKFFLPAACRTQYVADMMTFEDRYILVGAVDLACLGTGRSFLLFDAETGKFHEV